MPKFVEFELTMKQGPIAINQNEVLKVRPHDENNDKHSTIQFSNGDYSTVIGTYREVVDKLNM